eukprot:g63094.t1
MHFFATVEKGLGSFLLKKGRPLAFPKSEQNRSQKHVVSSPFALAQLGFAMKKRKNEREEQRQRLNATRLQVTHTCALLHSSCLCLQQVARGLGFLSSPASAAPPASTTTSACFGSTDTLSSQTLAAQPRPRVTGQRNGDCLVLASIQGGDHDGIQVSFAVEDRKLVREPPHPDSRSVARTPSHGNVGGRRCEALHRLRAQLFGRACKVGLCCNM